MNINNDSIPSRSLLRPSGARLSDLLAPPQRNYQCYSCLKTATVVSVIGLIAIGLLGVIASLFGVFPMGGVLLGGGALIALGIILLTSVM